MKTQKVSSKTKKDKKENSKSFLKELINSKDFGKRVEDGVIYSDSYKNPMRRKEGATAFLREYGTPEEIIIYWNKVYQELNKTKKLINFDFFSGNVNKPKEVYKTKYASFDKYKEACLPEAKKITRESFDVNVSDVDKKGKRVYFVTSAIAGDAVCKEFLKSIRVFCEDRNAKLVVLPMRGVRSKDEEIGSELEEISDLFVTNYEFNSNVAAMDMRIHPRQSLPLFNLQKLSRKESTIIAHPQQQFKTIPVAIGHLPHIQVSTGSITRGNTYGNIRTSEISKKEHTIGGLVLEVVNDEIFHIRQVQANTSDYSFHDLNKKYTQTGVKEENPVAIYLGDYHSGFTHEGAKKATYEMLKFFKPKHVFVGDVLDNHSISHHHEHNISAQVHRLERINTLEKELDYAAKEIKQFADTFPKTTFNLIKGNHEEHLDRYLDEERQYKDRVNIILATELFGVHLSGKNAFEYYCYKKYPSLLKNIVFLDRKSSHKIGGVENAIHGDLTMGGMKASIQGLFSSFGKCNAGHSHRPEIYKGVFRAGTLSIFDLSYIKGSGSDWLNTHVVNYSDGSRTLVTIINEKFMM